MSELFSLLFEHFWIVLIIFFIWWAMKVIFNEKEIKKMEERSKKLEIEKRVAKFEADLMLAEGRIKELEHENQLLRIRNRELEDI